VAGKMLGQHKKRGDSKKTPQFYYSKNKKEFLPAV
jgi:hypothetical protein